MTALPAAELAGAGAHEMPVRLIPDIPVIDPWTGQNFQQYGPHTAYLLWLLRQPGDPARYRPADFHPLIARVRHAHYRRGGHRTRSMRRDGTLSARRQLDALTLGLCCGWRALDRVQARWLHAWLGSLLGAGERGGESWLGSRAERTLAEYCREHCRPRHSDRVETAFRRISAAGMMGIYENACCFESWRDVEMLLMSAWRSGISLVDEEGHLLPGWKPRFALAFAMRFPEIS
ncbi:MAG: hypothetical protein ACLFV8_10825 [Alphaproteobacteria bacterium]